MTTATVGADVTFEVEVPAYTPKPPNLRVTRIAGASGDYRSAPTGDALDLRWEERRGGPLFLVTGSAMICGLGFATLLHQGNDTFLTFTFGSFAGLFAFLAIRLAFFFRGDTTISATSSEIRVVRSGGAASTMPVADLTDSVCWERAVRSGHVGESDDATPIYRRVYDIAVVQGDGTRVVLAESAHKELAFHVVSLLRQHLIASRRVA